MCDCTIAKYKNFNLIYKMEFKPHVYHPLIEEGDSRLTRKWAPRAIAQANFTTLFIRTYFAELQLSVNPYSLYNGLKYL